MLPYWWRLLHVFLNLLDLLSAWFDCSFISLCHSFLFSLCLPFTLWSIIFILFCKTSWSYCHPPVSSCATSSSTACTTPAFSGLEGVGGFLLLCILPFCFYACSGVLCLSNFPPSLFLCFASDLGFLFCWCPSYFSGIYFAIFFSLLLSSFILRPAFLLKTGADASLVPLFFNSSQEPLSSSIQFSKSRSGTRFSLSAAQSPFWCTVSVLGQLDSASSGAFERSTFVQLRLPIFLEHLVSITTLSVVLCVAASIVASCHCSYLLICSFSPLCKSYQLNLCFLAPRFLLCLLPLKYWLWRKQPET